MVKRQAKKGTYWHKGMFSQNKIGQAIEWDIALEKMNINIG